MTGTTLTKILLNLNELESYAENIAKAPEKQPRTPQAEYDQLHKLINELHSALEALKKGHVLGTNGQKIVPSAKTSHKLQQTLSHIATIGSLFNRGIPTKEEQEKASTIVAALRAIEEFKLELQNLDPEAKINIHLRRGKEVEKTGKGSMAF